MKSKKWIISIAVAVALVAALGTTVAFAAEGNTSGLGQELGKLNDNGNGNGTIYSEERLAELVDEGVITQEQADSILAGEALLSDFICSEDCEELGLYGRGEANLYSEDRLAELVAEGVITQEQADSILAGEAQLSDFVSSDYCTALGEANYGSQNSYGASGSSRGNNRNG